MSFIEAKEPCWSVQCDCCENFLGGEEHEHIHFSCEADASDAVDAYGWVSYDGTQYCEDCVNDGHPRGL
jgi:hypothetical protein